MNKLIVIIIGVVFLIIGGGTCAKCTSGYTGLDQSSAEENALQWASDMGMKDVKVSCVKMDSDGDGYVSCTVMANDKMHNIECTGWLTINDGCRTPKFKVN